MAQAETNISNRIRLAVSQVGARLFRNNRGLFKTLDGKRKVRAGLEADGSSDLIGWTPVEITEDMVGKTMAVFTAVEVKKNGGRVSKDQQNFIRAVQDFGGIAGVARSEEEALEILR